MNEGDSVKNFCLEGINPNGEEGKFCIEDFVRDEKHLILYFYPRDNTSGCTTEAVDFRDKIVEISDYAIVVGVSPDSIKSHKNFMAKHELNFHLLSDPDKKIMSDFDAFGEKKMYGKIRMGVIRSTFIISPELKILKKWRNVRAKGHVEKVITELEKIKKEK